MVVKNNDLKKRSIYVYLPTVQMVRFWKKLATKTNVSLSKFVADHVENSLTQEENKKGYPTRVELIKMLKEKNEQQEKLLNNDTIISEFRLDCQNRGFIAETIRRTAE